jgi:hypothetical protein
METEKYDHDADSQNNESRDEVLRFFNLMKSLNTDLENYSNKMEEFHKAGLIEDIHYRFLTASLLDVQSASKDLSITIEAIKKAIG